MAGWEPGATRGLCFSKPARWTCPFLVELSGRCFEEKAPLAAGLRIRGLTYTTVTACQLGAAVLWRTKHPAIRDSDVPTSASKLSWHCSSMPRLILALYD